MELDPWKKTQLRRVTQTFPDLETDTCIDILASVNWKADDAICQLNGEDFPNSSHLDEANDWPSLSSSNSSCSQKVKQKNSDERCQSAPICRQNKFSDDNNDLLNWPDSPTRQSSDWETVSVVSSPSETSEENSTDSQQTDSPYFLYENDVQRVLRDEANLLQNLFYTAPSRELDDIFLKCKGNLMWCIEILATDDRYPMADEVSGDRTTSLKFSESGEIFSPEDNYGKDFNENLSSSEQQRLRERKFRRGSKVEKSLPLSTISTRSASCLEESIIIKNSSFSTIGDLERSYSTPTMGKATPTSGNQTSSTVSTETNDKGAAGQVGRTRDVEREAHMTFNDWRERAYFHHCRRMELREKISYVPKPYAGAIVNYYRSEMLKEQALMHQANVNAKKLILSEYGTGSRAQKADTVLDLHFLYVQEALSALQGFLQGWKERVRSGDTGTVVLKVITGKGKNSNGKVAKIRPSVVQFLQSNNYCHMTLEGLILITLGASPQNGN